jgi:hypothetical protein
MEVRGSVATVVVTLARGRITRAHRDLVCAIDQLQEAVADLPPDARMLALQSCNAAEACVDGAVSAGLGSTLDVGPEGFDNGEEGGLSLVP